MLLVAGWRILNAPGRRVALPAPTFPVARDGPGGARSPTMTIDAVSDPTRFAPANAPPRRLVIPLLGLAALAAGSAAVVLLGDRVLLAEPSGLLGVFLLSLVGNATIVLPVPAIAAAFAAGAAFNPLLVGVVAAAGATLGELTGYLAGASGRGIVRHRVGHRRIETWMGRRGALTLLVLAAVPNPFFDLAGMTAGVVRYPVWRFLAFTWAGKSVKFLAAAGLGYRLLG
jgi:uncharacterized membrane protein YdjX (TVP38/TMEM64 family)